MVAKPDLGGKPLWMKILFGSLAVTAATVALVTVVVMVADQGEPERKRRLMIQSGLPGDFFGPPDVPLSPADEAARERIIYLEKEQEKARAAEKQERAQAAKKRGKAAAKPAPPPDVNTLFGATQVSQQRFDDAQRLNKMRRGSGAVLSSYSSSGGPDGIRKQGVASVDEDWSDYGVGKDTASYPVNLERVVTVDRFIPAILVNEVDSELQGKVVAVIENNVYGAHGRFVLIPAGSRAVGMYEPLKKAGDTRLMVKWNRIITPDGINVSFERPAIMADAMGRSGITGDVDNKYWEKYGIALLISTLNAAASVSIPVDNNNQRIVIENYGRELGQLSNTILQENINIAPTVTIPAGSRILINPITDIWFQEPKRNQMVGIALEDKGETP